MSSMLILVLEIDELTMQLMEKDEMFSSIVTTRVCAEHPILTLPMLRLFCSKHKDVRFLKNHLNPVMLVFIG